MFSESVGQIKYLRLDFIILQIQDIHPVFLIRNILSLKIQFRNLPYYNLNNTIIFSLRISKF